MTRTKKIELLPTLFDSMDVPDGSYEFYYREQPFVLYVDFLHHKKNSNLSRRSSFALFETEEKIQPGLGRPQQDTVPHPLPAARAGRTL